MNAQIALPDRLRRTDRDRVMITPEGIALPITVASRGSRAGALMLDLMLIAFLQVATTLFLIYLGFGTLRNVSSLGGDGGGLGAVEFLVVLWIIAMFLFRNAYFLFFELGPRGATPGKRIAGIRIAARDGGRLSVDMVIARNLLRDIELFLPLVFIASAGEGQGGAAGFAAAAWFLIFALFPFFNKDRLRAGDIVAGSWVVERPKQKLQAAMSAPAPAWARARDDAPVPAPAELQFTDAELSAYGEFELQTLERVLRANRKEALLAVQHTIAGKIGREPVEADDARAFLEAYYTQLRARLESGMRLGRRKADKHS